MKRKLVAFVLVFALLASLSPAVAADEMSATPMVEEILSEHHGTTAEAQDTESVTNEAEMDEEVIVHDLARNQRIDELFYLRGQLEANFEENWEEILRIDQELQELGVENITYEELLLKAGDIAHPMVDVS